MCLKYLHESEFFEKKVIVSLREQKKVIVIPYKGKVKKYKTDIFSKNHFYLLKNEYYN